MTWTPPHYLKTDGDGHILGWIDCICTEEELSSPLSSPKSDCPIHGEKS